MRLGLGYPGKDMEKQGGTGSLAENCVFSYPSKRSSREGEDGIVVGLRTEHTLAGPA